MVDNPKAVANGEKEARGSKSGGVDDDGTAAGADERPGGTTADTADRPDGAPAMTAPVHDDAPRSDDGDHAVSEPLGEVEEDVDSRGRTELATRAVRRLAAHAATEIEGVVPGAKAEATVDGDSVALTVRLTLIYPAPIRKRVREVRAHLLSRVAELTGLTVTRLDINVSLTRATNSSGRVR